MSEAAQPTTPTALPEVLPRRFGRYTLLRRLASGGMAELYLALHRSLANFERLVVIKRILPELGRDQSFITMLLQEARIAATFSHPNIVTTFDVGQAEGEYFIAMEHIHGEDLRSIVRAMRPKNVKEFPLEHALAIGVGAAAGLAYAHEQKDLHGVPLAVVHRDISPQNILVTFTGDVKVVDFGIAKARLSHDAEATTGGDTGFTSGVVATGPLPDTGAGKVKGKLPYMSPEQARGEALDARSDIFSLGIILFELCTGRRLFRGSNDAETLQMILDGKYPDPSSVSKRVSPGLGAVISKALAFDRNDRYSTARELQSDLVRVVHAEHIALSSVAFGEWMQMLFAERLSSQQEALAQGKQLADVLAADEPDPGDTSSRSMPSGSSERAVASIPAPAPPVGHSRLTAALLAVIALLLLVVVAVVVMRAPAPAPVAPAPPPPAVTATPQPPLAPAPAPSVVVPEAQPPAAPPVAAEPPPPVEAPANVRAHRSHRTTTTTATTTAPAAVDNTPGRLTVGATPWCTVTVDGVGRGQTPVVGLSLPPGSHRIACINPERGTQERSVTLGPGQDLRVRITFP
ncbi:MAG: serine/threonine protein kinase [Deltaproteobacteria bacterium]|nr:serine/threonine protein kinase [Deltaproteobacteria bacterium]